MSAVLGIIKTASTVEIAGAAAGPTMETAAAIARNSKLMSRVLEQRGKWQECELQILPKWARIANQNDFTAKMAGESMAHWRTRVFQPDLTPLAKGELKVPYFHLDPYGIEVESHFASDIPARVYESTKNSVLRIDDLSLFGEGSGAIVNMGKEKVLTTAVHVLEVFKSPKHALVNFADGTFARVKEVQMGRYPENDVALVFVDKDLTRYPALKLGESKSLLPKEGLFSLGHPAGSKITTMSAGNLEKLDYRALINRNEQPIGWQSDTIRSSIRATGGVSGGPVMRWNKATSEAEMVGMSSTGSNVGSNAVTSETILKFVEQWRPEAIGKTVRDHWSEGLTRVVGA